MCTTEIDIDAAGSLIDRPRTSASLLTNLIAKDDLISLDTRSGHPVVGSANWNNVDLLSLGIICWHISEYDNLARKVVYISHSIHCKSLLIITINAALYITPNQGWKPNTIQISYESSGGSVVRVCVVHGV